MPNISFFIPAYNCAETIAESVASIMETNFKIGDELIIVNDCSSDNTAEVLLNIKDKYPVIQTLIHKRNKGGGAARNTAIESATNDLLFCLDSDNILEKNSIKPLKSHLLNSDADIASFQEMRYFSSDNKHDTQYIWHFPPVVSMADFMADHKNPGSSGNYLFTKKSWREAEGYPEFAGSLDTWGFCFRQLAAGSKLVTLPGSYYFHRYGGDSYYIRDMNSRNMSLAALQIILPYYHIFHPEDFNYIMSNENRMNWFENFDSRPIRILGGQVGLKSISVNAAQPKPNAGLAKKIYYRLRNKR
ncbi:MAG: glycosyltransferase family 2 protein [Bacteroidota bacterium]